MSKLHQDTKTGKLVELVSVVDNDFAMIKDAGGRVSYMALDQLTPYDKEKVVLVKLQNLSLPLKKKN